MNESLLKNGWRGRGEINDEKLAVIRRQFLPAALEIQDTPPSPAGRWLAFSLMMLFTAAVLWACFGEVDIVVTAPGRIIPGGQVKVIQPLDTGTVQKIHVKEGDRVKKGQLLVSLDPTYAQADNERISQQIADLSSQQSWRQALEHWLASDRSEEATLLFPANGDLLLQRKAQQLYQQQRDEITARVQTLHMEHEAALAEQQTANAELNRVKESLPILNEQVEAYSYLYDKKYGAKVQYLQIKQQQVELQTSIPILRSRRRQLEETAAALKSGTLALLLEQRKNNLMELHQLDSQLAGLKQDVKKAHQRQQQKILKAPVAGTVQQLAIHTIGGVVTPAQELMKIVPEQAVMEAEALIQNRDIGFINQGQSAEIKVDTFNFTKYGVIDASIKHIAQDATADEHLGWVYAMRFKLSKDKINIENKSVRLSPGMAVTVEIKTGKRRLIEFFLSPLLRYRQESVRER
ncbi:MAG: HlyD family type I secretion periplasmic adaptor subunit [Porticoccaceae bacterium]